MAGGVTHPERERIMDSSSAWNFNFNNGERNWNNRNNSNNKRVMQSAVMNSLSHYILHQEH